MKVKGIIEQEVQQVVCKICGGDIWVTDASLRRIKRCPFCKQVNLSNDDLSNEIIKRLSKDARL